MPERDMDETANSDMEFEDAVTAVLNAGPHVEDEDTED
jgi:hypothetical protein